MDEEKPPVRRLTLKPKEVERTDAVAVTGDGTAISVKLMHLENRNAEEKPMDTEGTRFAAASPRPTAIPFKPKNPVGAATQPPALVDESDDAISVHDMLQENRVATIATEPELIAMPPRRRSRRRQDFIMMLGVAIAATATLLFVFKADRELVVLGSVIVAFIALILAWIMFGVMDRY